MVFESLNFKAGVCSGGCLLIGLQLDSDYTYTAGLRQFGCSCDLAMFRAACVSTCRSRLVLRSSSEITNASCLEKFSL